MVVHTTGIGSRVLRHDTVVSIGSVGSAFTIGPIGPIAGISSEDEIVLDGQSASDLVEVDGIGGILGFACVPSKDREARESNGIVPPTDIQAVDGSRSGTAWCLSQDGCLIEGCVSFLEIASVSSIDVNIVVEEDGFLVDTRGHVDVS
jgi:hypothetical protein